MPDPAVPSSHNPKVAGRAMFDSDLVMQDHGAELLAAGDGSATVRLTVRDRMVQAHGTCHGGVLFALADATFGVACNTGPDPAVAQHCSISYLTPGKVGDVLTVTVDRRSQVGRTGIFDGTITTGDDKAVAEFRGVSRTLPKR